MPLQAPPRTSDRTDLEFCKKATVRGFHPRETAGEYRVNNVYASPVNIRFAKVRSEDGGESGDAGGIYASRQQGAARPASARHYEAGRGGCVEAAGSAFSCPDGRTLPWAVTPSPGSSTIPSTRLLHTRMPLAWITRIAVTASRDA